MWPRLSAVLGFSAVAIVLAIAPAAAGQGRSMFEQYTVKGDAAKIAKAIGGVELADVQQTRSGIKAAAVLTASQRAKLAATGVKVKLTRNKKGLTVTQQAARQAANGFNVYRSWDEPGGIRDELFQVARHNPQLVKLEVLGGTHQGRELIAMKLTQGASGIRDGSPRRSSTRRTSTRASGSASRSTAASALLHRRLAGERQGDQEPAQEDGAVVRHLGQPRRLPVHVRRGAPVAQEPAPSKTASLGSSRATASIRIATSMSTGATTTRARRPTRGRDLPRSERRLGARDPGDAGLIDRIKPKFQSNWHSFGEWLLYPQGWQVGTLDADYPIYVPRLTTARRPPIPGSTRVSPRTRSTSPTARPPTTPTPMGHGRVHPELGEGEPGAGFVFPDDEELIQAEFERTLDFDLGLARSAANPGNPVPGRDRRRAVLSTPTTSIRRTGRPRCSTSSSASPTAIRRRCACSPSAASATSRCITRSTAVRTRARRRASGRRRALRRRQRQYYHVVSGECDRHRPGRQRRGVVRGRR